MIIFSNVLILFD
jgi:protein disulfide-isomerase A1